MKKIILAFLLAGNSSSAISCPACVGKLTDTAPVFFKDELYQSIETVDCDDIENEQTSAHHKENS